MDAQPEVKVVVPEIKVNVVLPTEDLHIVVARIEENTKDTNARVKQIEKAVFIGNGVPPLVSRVTALESSSSTTRWIIGIAIAAGTMFTSALALVLHFNPHVGF